MQNWIAREIGERSESVHNGRLNLEAVTSSERSTTSTLATGTKVLVNKLLGSFVHGTLGSHFRIEVPELLLIRLVNDMLVGALNQ